MIERNERINPMEYPDGNYKCTGQHKRSCNTGAVLMIPSSQTMRNLKGPDKKSQKRDMSKMDARMGLLYILSGSMQHILVH